MLAKKVKEEEIKYVKRKTEKMTEEHDGVTRKNRKYGSGGLVRLSRDGR